VAAWDAAQYSKGVHVAFEERLLAGGGEHSVHGLAGVGQPQREQVDPSSSCRRARCGTRRSRPPPRPPADGFAARTSPAARVRPPAVLRPPGLHVDADHRVGDVEGAVLVNQAVEDPLSGVPLLRWRVQVRPQHRVDELLVRIQTRLTRSRPLPRLWPLPVQGPTYGPPGDVVLALQGSLGQPVAVVVTANRGVQLPSTPTSSPLREVHTPRSHRKSSADVKTNRHSKLGQNVTPVVTSERLPPSVTEPPRVTDHTTWARPVGGSHDSGRSGSHLISGEHALVGRARAKIPPGSPAGCGVTREDRAPRERPRGSPVQAVEGPTRGVPLHRAACCPRWI
jgi:hypothetical protein